MKALVVQKFGGTSVGSLERIANVAALVQQTLNEQRNVVVVSAMAGETNKLVAMARELAQDPHPQAYDMLLASGEQVTCALLAIALKEKGVAAVPLLGFQVGIETDDLFTKAKIQNIRTELLNRYIEKGVVPVIAGFQGVQTTRDGESFITTLGRGGSDTSAVAIAAALKADRCDIFTDVEGVFSADPRVVPNAHALEKITFAEMMELASLGAKVLHMRCVELAAKFELPLRVLSTFAPHKKGTTLVTEHEMLSSKTRSSRKEPRMSLAQDTYLESAVVSSITTDNAECLLSVRVPEKEAQFPARFFRPLANAGINVDVIVKTPADHEGFSVLSFTVPREEGHKTKEILSKYAVEIQRDSTVKLSIVGIGMRTHSGVAATMFETLESLSIPMHLITTSEIKVSVLIDDSHREKAIRALHEVFAL